MRRFENKVLAFGLLGILGCLAGWAVGEAYWWGVHGVTPQEAVAGTLGSTPKPPALTAVTTKPAAPPPPIQPEPPRLSTPAPLPPEIAKRLQRAGAEAGEIEITLSWNNRNDLDLHCFEPDGNEIYFVKKESKSGGKLDVDRNIGGRYGSSAVNDPVEHIRWKGRTPPHGHYKVKVSYFLWQKPKPQPKEGEPAPPATEPEEHNPTEYRVDIKGAGLDVTRTGIISEKQDVLVYEFDFEPTPAGVRLAAPPEVVVSQAGKNELTVRVARDKCEGPVEIQFEGQIDGLHFGPNRGEDAQRVTIPADRSEAVVSVQADEFAAGGTRRIQAVARAGELVGRSNMFVQLQELPTALRVAAPTEPVPLSAGGSNTMAIRVARDHCAEPITLSFEGDLEGVTMPAVVIPADKSEAEVVVTAAADVRVAARAVRAVAAAGSASHACPFQIALGPGAVRSARSWLTIPITGGWTALLAVCLALTLVMAQNRYQAKRLLAARQTLLVLVGGALAGLIAGSTGQVLYDLLDRAALPPRLGFLAGWLLLGLMLGWGVGLFIPNLKRTRSAAAGAVGGCLGAAAFIGVAALGSGSVQEILARGAGAVILGFCIGLMVAIVEAVCREAWIEVYYGPKECKTFSLGRQPVTIGSGPECTVYVSKAPEVALTYVLEDGRIRCRRGGGAASSPVAPGQEETVGSVRVVARGSVQTQTTGWGGAPATTPTDGALRLQLPNGKRYRLAVGERLGAQELPGVLPHKGEGPVAEVVANPKNPSVLGLKNLSKSVWTVVLPEGQKRQIELGQSIQLRVGLKVNFGELQAEVTAT
jgi:hypothetical protein